MTEDAKHRGHHDSVEKIVRDYHGDGDFVWTDVEVGALVQRIEAFEDSWFAFTQWAKHPTSPGATGQALMAAQRMTAEGTAGDD